MKNHIDFYNDFETTFSWFWDDFGSKNLPKMKGPGSLFQPGCEYAKSVILNNPPMVLLYFSTLEAMIFYFNGDIFQLFFQRRSWDRLFAILGRILLQLGRQKGLKIHEKINEKVASRNAFKSHHKPCEESAYVQKLNVPQVR